MKYVPTLGLAALAALLFAAPLEAAELRVMSFNVRFDAGLPATTDPNGWANPCAPRRDRALNVIQAFDPDLLGVQEALFNQAVDLGDALPGYGFYGVGRTDGNLLGEFSGIYYRAARFTKTGEGTFWLSETPDVPGSVLPGSGSIRIASWVKLVDLASGESLFYLNTHLDNSCASCRLRGAEIIRDKIAALAGGHPVLVTGDMNASENSAPLLELKGANDPGEVQLADAYRAVFPAVDPNEGTFHGFGGGVAGSRIDFVLGESFFAPSAASIVRTGFACGWPSDHYPVTATYAVPGAAPAREDKSIADPCDATCPPGCGPVFSPRPAVLRAR